LGDEIQFKTDGIVAGRAVHVLDQALRLLEEVHRDSIWDAIGRGAFADVKRERTGGRGYAGVVERNRSYLNPLLAELEASG
jgi:beta-lysine 5,6-aminomutase alpha subunit